MPDWVIYVLISIAVNVAASLLTPRPDPTEPTPLDDPTAESGKPITVIFGTRSVRGGNILHYGDKATRTYKVKV